MKRWLLRITVVLVLAVVFHVITVMLYPYGTLLALSYKNKKAGRKVNIVYHAPRMSAKSRDVVRPNPDVLYSSCAYDVSKAPLRITAPVPDTYWSLSLYAANTDNFFVVNDREVKSKHMDILLVGPNVSFSESEDAKVVVSPSQRGAMIIRILITDENRVHELIEMQKQAVCESLTQF